MFVSDNFYIVEFDDGQSIVRGTWLTEDQKYSAWPRHADSLSPLDYDRFVQKEENPSDDWLVLPIKIRAYSGEYLLLLLVCTLKHLRAFDLH